MCHHYESKPEYGQHVIELYYQVNCIWQVQETWRAVYFYLAVEVNLGLYPVIAPGEEPISVPICH